MVLATVEEMGGGVLAGASLILREPGRRLELAWVGPAVDERFLRSGRR